MGQTDGQTDGRTDVSRGTHCRHVCATLLTVLLFLAVFLKHLSFQSTSVYSALEALANMRYVNRRFT